MKRFNVSEILILLVSVICIFVSEYIFLFQNDPMKAIFIGLWPPTMLGLVNYINSKKQR